MWNMTERQKMISGQLYKSGVKELVNDRMLCKEQCYDFNALRPLQTEQQSAMIKKIFGKVGANCFITAPFWCDYGYNIEAGDNFYANHNLVILDCAKVTFGNNVVIGGGSVVVKDIPDNSIAVGNPCKVIKKIESGKAREYNIEEKHI